MKQNNISLDIETAGKGPNAAIVSIGAVVFDPLTGELGSEFYQVIKLASSANYGKLDADTLQWWFKQTPQAQAVFNDTSAVSLRTALELFSAWLEQTGPVKTRMVWGNGPAFDNVIVSSAYNAIEIKTPWYFNNDRCVRTILNMARDIVDYDAKAELKLEGTAHNALDDAKYQARYVSAAYQALAGHNKNVMAEIADSKA
jgi:exodeoxyribonuclease VIII